MFQTRASAISLPVRVIGEKGTEAVPGPVLSVVVPTRNESGNVGPLLRRLAAALRETAEVVFVDDSDDATGYRVRRLTEAQQWGTLAISLVHRPLGLRKGGLGGAVAEGIRRARGEWVCVMDGDLQHPPEVVAELLAEGRRRGVDVVIGTRYGDAAGFDDAMSPARRAMSRICASGCKVLFPLRFRKVSDPMSGFFLVRRAKVDPNRLRPRGFKILLEILGRHPELTTAEVGYQFHTRNSGVSNVSAREAGRFVSQLASLRLQPSREHTASPEPFRYDIHGIATVESECRLPELEAFRTRQLSAPPSICVHSDRFQGNGSRHIVDLTQISPRVRYQERLVGTSGFVAEIELGDTVDVTVSRLVARSPHVLYTNVIEPILRWRLVESGYAMVHAASFVDGGRAYMVTARTDTGKTTTMLKVLDELAHVEFLSDDLVIVDPTGRVLAYPKPLTISAHTLHALKRGELDRLERAFLPLQSRIHSRSGRRFAFLLKSSKLPVASINAVVQILVPPPKYHVNRLVPGVVMSRSARIEEMFVIERSADDSVAPLSPDIAIDTLLVNCADAFGFPPYDTLERLLHSASNEDLRAREREIITAAFSCVPASLLRSSTMGWATPITARVRASEDAPPHEFWVQDGLSGGHPADGAMGTSGQLGPLVVAARGNGHGSNGHGHHSNGHGHHSNGLLGGNGHLANGPGGNAGSAGRRDGGESPSGRHV